VEEVEDGERAREARIFVVAVVDVGFFLASLLCLLFVCARSLGCCF